MRGEQELRARLSELDARIAARPGWGAAVGAMDEERREIKLSLTHLTRSPIVKDPERAAALADLQRAYACLDRVYEYLKDSPPAPQGKPAPSPPTLSPLPPVRTARKWWWQREFWSDRLIKRQLKQRKADFDAGGKR